MTSPIWQKVWVSCPRPESSALRERAGHVLSQSHLPFTIRSSAWTEERAERSCNTHHNGVLYPLLTKPILEAIEGCKAVLMVRNDHLTSECTLIRHDLTKSEVGLLKRRIASDQWRINRQRRNNISVEGLPEGAEGLHPAVFAESLFKKMLNLPDMPPNYIFERAYSIPTGKRPASTLPRLFLVHFLNFRDRDMILAKARKHPELPYENNRVRLFPDFSADVQKSH